MKKKNFIAVQAIVILLFSFMNVGCSKDEPINSVDSVDNSRPTLVFSLRVADISIGGTRALTEADENLIKDVKLLLFDNNNNLVEMPDVELKSGGPTSSVYTIEVEKESYGSAVLIANVGGLIDGGFFSANNGKNKETILTSLIIESGKWNAVPGSSGYMAIPMWGEVNSVEINRGANVTNVITFQMLRMLARINVAVKDDVDFTLEDVRLYNYYNKGAVVPASKNLVEDKAEVKVVTIPDGVEKPTNATQNPYVYKVGEGETSLINEIYTFEAEAGSDEKFLENTALVIGGKYGSDAKVTYYRVDFIANEEYLPLLRNHSYNVNVSNVDGSGQSSPLSAFESLESLLKVEIAVWNDVDIDADLGGNGGEPGGDVDDEDGENGSEVEGGEDDGNNNELPETVRSESNSYIVKPYELIHIPVSRANQSDLSTQLNSGENYTVELMWQDELSVVSEVFVVDNGTDKRYIAVQAAGKHGNAVVAIKKEGAILWSWHIWVTDYEPNGKWMDRNLGATNNEQGSVGALGLYYQWGRKDPFPGSSSISLEHQQKNIYDIYNKVVSIYKTNSIIPASGKNNLTEATTNPTTFYINYDWYGGNGGPRNNDLWGANGNKSVYDPCPEGYRVPEFTDEKSGVDPWSDKTFTEFKHIAKIGYFGEDYGGFYPFAGEMGGAGASDGAITKVGSLGKYWTASASDKTALLLDLSSSVKRTTSPRAYGLSVRCIKE